MEILIEIKFKYDSDIVLLFFFVQAEDGIRDRTVTGVQTCALPICRVLCSRLEILPMLFIVHCGQVTSLHNVTAKAYSEQVISISIQSSIRVRQHRIGR